MPPNHFRRNRMNIEELKKRKVLIENNLKQLNQKIIKDTQNALRFEGAILDVDEIIIEEEKKEHKDKKEEKVEKKKVK